MSRIARNSISPSHSNAVYIQNKVASRPSTPEQLHYLAFHDRHCFFFSLPHFGRLLRVFCPAPLHSIPLSDLSSGLQHAPCLTSQNKIFKQGPDMPSAISRTGFSVPTEVVSLTGRHPVHCRHGTRSSFELTESCKPANLHPSSHSQFGDMIGVSPKPAGVLEPGEVGFGGRRTTDSFVACLGLPVWGSPWSRCAARRKRGNVAEAPRVLTSPNSSVPRRRNTVTP